MISEGRKAERNREIYQLRMSSQLTYREIGERYGVCGERVRQLCAKIGAIERREKRLRESGEREETEE